MPDPRLATLLPSDRGRMYTHPVTREQHVSSTTVLKMWPKKLDRWAAKEAAGEAWDQREWLQRVTREQAVDALQGAPERSRNKAGTHGRLVHEGCELLAMRAAGWELTNEQSNKLMTMLVGLQGASTQQALFRFAEWADKYVAQWLHLEQTVWGNGWAGTFDAIVLLKDGRIALVDYKTGSAIFVEVAMQLASYWGAPIILNAEGVEIIMPPIDVCTVVHLPQVGGYGFLDCEVKERDLEAFERTLENWHYAQDRSMTIGVAIPIATAPWVPGVRECGAARPSPQTGRAGSVACIRPQGHDGDHQGQSRTGSRKYYWSDADVPGADVLASTEAELAPIESAQRPVLNVLEGGAIDSATGAAPLQGSGQLPPPGLTNEEMIQWWKNKQAGLDPETGDPIDVPGASTGPETTETSSPSGSDPISLPVPDVPGPDEAQPAPDSGGFPVPAPSIHSSENPEEYGVADYMAAARDGSSATGTPELDEAQSYSSKIAELFTKPGEAVMRTDQNLNDLIAELATTGIREGYLAIVDTRGQTIKLGLTEKGHDFLNEYLDERDWRVRMEAW